MKLVQMSKSKKRTKNKKNLSTYILLFNVKHTVRQKITPMNNHTSIMTQTSIKFYKQLLLPATTIDLRYNDRQKTSLSSADLVLDDTE